MSRNDIFGTISAVIGYVSLVLRHIVKGDPEVLLYYTGMYFLGAAAFYFGVQLAFLIVLLIDIGFPWPN